MEKRFNFLKALNKRKILKSDGRNDKKFQRGNVALFFAIAALPLSILFGAGVELSNISTAKNQLQGAVDAAAIDNATYGRGVSTTGRDYAEDFIKPSLKPQTTLKTVTIKKETKSGTEVVTLNATATIKPIVGSLFGKSKYDLTAAASATASMGKNEIVFALDNTASMSQNNRMVNLKAAVKKVLGQLQEQSTGENVKVGIVPFNTMVKMEPGTSLNYINYGRTASSWSCDYSLGIDPWPGCSIGWHQLNAICAGIASRPECDNNVVFYEIPITYTGSEAVYSQIAKTYVRTGSTYKVITISIKYRRSDGTGYCSGYSSDETGSWCSSWTTTSSGYEVFENEAMSTYNNQSNLNLYNSSPGGSYKKMPQFLKWDYSTGEGFAADTNTYRWYYTQYNSRSRESFVPASIEKKSNWKGCIHDRDQSYDTSADEAKAAVPSSLYFARNCENEPLQATTGLTNDFQLLNSKVDSMQPAGYTNITIGLQFAMEVLSPSEPYTSGASFNDLTVRKTIILVTDGANTKNRFTNNATEINKRTELACKNAKALKINMFIIRLEEGDDALLQSCATIPPYYFDLKSSSQIGDALQSVLASMGNVRLVN